MEEEESKERKLAQSWLLLKRRSQAHKSGSSGTFTLEEEQTVNGIKRFPPPPYEQHVSLNFFVRFHFTSDRLRYREFH